MIKKYIINDLVLNTLKVESRLPNTNDLVKIKLIMMQMLD